MRLYIGRNSVPKFRGKFFEDEDLKTTKIREIGPKKEQSCAQGMAIRPYAPRICAKLHYMRLGHALCAPSISNARGTSVILFFFLGLARVFRLNPVRNLHYKYHPSSFRISRSELRQFKMKATLEVQESFYLLLNFLGYVFIFSNLFLDTMCN